MDVGQRLFGCLKTGMYQTFAITKIKANFFQHFGQLINVILLIIILNFYLASQIIGNLLTVIVFISNAKPLTYFIIMLGLSICAGFGFLFIPNVEKKKQPSPEELVIIPKIKMCLKYLVDRYVMKI